MEAFMYLCHPQTHAVLEAIQRGAIGKLNLIRTNFCYATSKLSGNVRFERTLGGGALMDVGCYCISLARLLCNGEPTRIHAFGRMHDSGVDELTTVAMEFPGKVMSHFSCAMLTHADNAAHISGSDGWLEIPWPWKPSPDRSGYVLSRGVAPRQDQATGAKDASQAPVASARQSVSIPVDGDLFGIEADEFATAVLDGVAPRVSREFTVGNMRVLDEIRRQIGLAW
jgi:predicted dehydrogenase